LVHCPQESGSPHADGQGAKPTASVPAFIVFGGVCLLFGFPGAFLQGAFLLATLLPPFHFLVKRLAPRFLALQPFFVTAPVLLKLLLALPRLTFLALFPFLLALFFSLAALPLALFQTLPLAFQLVLAAFPVLFTTLTSPLLPRFPPYRSGGSFPFPLNEHLDDIERLVCEITPQLRVCQLRKQFLAAALGLWN
jgi:hypothetical protein